MFFISAHKIQALTVTVIVAEKTDTDRHT